MSHKKNIDYLLLFAVIALLSVGLLMVFSASPTMGLKYGDSYYFIKRHIFYLLVGGVAFFYGFKIDLFYLKKWAGMLFLFSIVCLLLVYVPGVGKKISGASRWIDIGIFTFQPSELIKIAMIIFLANTLSRLGNKIRDFYQGLLPVLAIIAVVLALVVKQPDLGTAMVIGCISFALLFLAGARFLHLGALGGIALIGVLILSVTSSYRLRRLVAYLDPWKDPQGIGFQIIQSLLAVGSGGLWGLGLGASRQKYFYLPQQFTDFIFAILCEELGCIGGMAMVFFFAIFMIRGLKIAKEETDSFNSLLAAGLVIWITIQALINMLVVVGVLPTTGVPLPFISYGGTSTVMSLFATGILLNLSLRSRVRKT
jgi:cell division protein FtsW